MSINKGLREILSEKPVEIASILSFDLRRSEPVIFDFTVNNLDLEGIDLNDTAGFSDHLFQEINAHDPPVGIGRYNEDRVLYRHSPLFDGRMERRSVHLGIDLFVESGVGVMAPLEATVHSFADNATLGNYGPAIILEHQLAGLTFFSLYGHLSRDSLERLRPGLRIQAGEQIAAIGTTHENGSWPPHLHFQLISDMLGNAGDFPGVAAPSERERFLEMCPDPNLLLEIPGL